MVYMSTLGVRTHGFLQDFPTNPLYSTWFPSCHLLGPGGRGAMVPWSADNVNLAPVPQCWNSIGARAWDRPPMIGAMCDNYYIRM